MGYAVNKFFYMTIYYRIMDLGVTVIGFNGCPHNGDPDVIYLSALPQYLLEIELVLSFSVLYHCFFYIVVFYLRSVDLYHFI